MWRDKRHTSSPAQHKHVLFTDSIAAHSLTLNSKQQWSTESLIKMFFLWKRRRRRRGGGERGEEEGEGEEEKEGVGEEENEGGGEGGGKRGGGGGGGKGRDIKNKTKQKKHWLATDSPGSLACTSCS